jgi:hypothetical protein
MNTLNIILGVIMIGIGIPMVIVQAKAINAGKHTPGDFIVRLLITGIGGIILGIMIIVKNL